MAIPFSYNIRSVVARWKAAVLSVLGIAGTVGVFIAMLALARGFEATLVSSGSPENAIVRRAGATSEMDSSVSLDELRALEDAPRVLDEDTRLALEGGREDLARFAIRKLLPKRSEAAALRGRVDEIRTERECLAPKLEEQEAEFEELRGRVREKLAAETRATESESPCAEWRVAEEEVEMELLRRMQAAGGTK